VILYSAEKKFLGMDYEDLAQLGYASFAEFLEKYQDFADTFIDRPGYIYNYEDFSWIDYVLNSNDTEFKAMIYTEDTGFACDLEITPYYLVQTPQEAAFAIHLHHIRALSKEEIGYINKMAANGKGNVEHVNLFHDEHDGINILSSVDTPSIKHNSPAAFQPQKQERVEIEPQVNSNSFSHDSSKLLQKLKVSPNYRFDPIIAAEELGLAVEVIEEFIDDFIAQALQVKQELLGAIHKKEYATVKEISHKLKGVAANLRIEDSLEVLTLINASENQNELVVYVNHFYTLIDRLHQNNEALKPLNTQEEEEIEAPLLSIDEAISFDEEDTPQENESVSTNEDPRQEEDNDEELLGLDLDIEIPQEEETAAKISAEESSQQENQDDDTMLLSIDEDIPSQEDLHPLETNLPDLNFNPLQASSEMGIDMGLFLDLLEDFKNDIPHYIQTLRQANVQENFETLHQTTQTLKDISDNLHIDEISTTVRSIQESKDSNEIKHLIDILEHYTTQL